MLTLFMVGRVGCLMRWVERAACVGSGLDWDVDPPAEGCRELCAGCPVRLECLSEGLRRRDSVGCWAGLSEQERRLVRRGRVTPEQVWRRNETV